MGNITGNIDGGNLGEQLKIAVKATSTTAIVPPAVQNGTVTSDAFDRLGFNSAIIQANVGAIVAVGNYTLKLQDSDDNGAADAFADVSSTKAGWGAVATAAGAVGTANTDVQLKADLRQMKRYVRVIGTLVSGTSVLFGVSVILGAGDVQPASAN